MNFSNNDYWRQFRYNFQKKIKQNKIFRGILREFSKDLRSDKFKKGFRGRSSGFIGLIIQLFVRIQKIQKE